MKQVLKALAKWELLLDPEKCEWHKEEVVFLGFIIGRSRIRIDPAKVEVVLK